MGEYRFQDGDLVAFDAGPTRGKGCVRGVAAVQAPTIGCLYILEVIECDPELPNDIYPFKYIALPEIYFHKIEEE